MFMFFSLLTASIDGFICGFALSGLGVKFRFKDSVISFTTIAICCLTAALRGKYLSLTQFQKYINLFGCIVLLYLALSALVTDNKANVQKNIIKASFSVAADASVACLYLAMLDYNIFAIAFISAFLHSVLMVAANIFAYKIIKTRYLIYVRYLAAVLFILMAFSKLTDI